MPGKQLSSSCRGTYSMCFAVAFLMSLSSVLATGQTFDVLHRFNINTDGAQPQGGLIADRAGNL